MFVELNELKNRLLTWNNDRGKGKKLPMRDLLKMKFKKQIIRRSVEPDIFTIKF